MRFALALWLLLSMAFLGCGSDEEAEGQPDPPSLETDGEGRWTIEEARAFDEFTLYWLGESYDGLPLTRIIRSGFTPPPGVPSFEGEDVVIFIYGDCDPPLGDDTGCPLPLSVRVEPYCTRPPEILAESRKESLVADFRGVDALVNEGQITMWSGDVRISVFAHRAASEAAMDLMALDDDGPRSGEPLPPARPEDCAAATP